MAVPAVAAMAPPELPPLSAVYGCWKDFSLDSRRSQLDEVG